MFSYGCLKQLIYVYIPKTPEENSTVVKGELSLYMTRKTTHTGNMQASKQHMPGIYGTSFHLSKRAEK